MLPADDIDVLLFDASLNHADVHESSRVFMRRTSAPQAPGVAAEHTVR